MKSAAMRRFLHVLRLFLRTQTFDINQEFLHVLSKSFGSFYKAVWITSRAFFVLEGKQIVAFIKTISSVAPFLKSKFIMTDTLDSLCCGLLGWQNISQFLHRVKIVDTSKPSTEQYKQKTEFEKEISTFKSNLEQFYKFGSQSFLTVKK